MNEEHGLGDALRVVEELAKEAASAADAMVLKNEAEAHGLPKHMPVLMRLGKDVELKSLRALMEEWRIAPERREGTATVRTLRSFIELSMRHKDEHSTIFAQTDWPNPSLTTVVDYHQTDGVPRFGRHRIVYPFPLTREFKTWINQDGKPLEGDEFAIFIEDNIMDLSVPLDTEREQFEELFRTKFAVPTDLIALARGLEINVDSKVKQAFKLESGEAEIRFEETHKSASGEPIHVPGLFMLSCRAFVGGQEVRLPARLRYRVKDGAIKWHYQLYKWEDALRARTATDLAIAAQATGLPAFEGAPETKP